MDYIKCKNCYCRVPGKYCPNCGQSSRIAPLTWGAVWEGIIHGFTHAEGGVFYTVKMLFTRPGRVFSDYIAGRRIIYARPFSFLILLSIFYQLVFSLCRAIWFPEVPEVSPDSQNLMPREINDSLDSFLQKPEFLPLLQFFEILKKWMTHSISFTTLGAVFLYAYAMKISFRKVNKQKYSYVELLSTSVFMACQRILINFVLLPYQIYTMVHQKGGYGIVAGVVFFMLTFFDMKGLFNLSWGQARRRTILMFLRMGLLLLLGFVGLIFLVVIVKLILDANLINEIKDALRRN